MNRYRLWLAALLFAAPAVAFAGTSTPGVNLRWDQCYADGGAWNKSFACDTNSGTERMIASFELASDFPVPVSGMEITMNVGSVGALPSWWHFRSIGTCRQASLSMTSVQPAGAVSCIDWASGNATGGIGAYTIGNPNPSGAYIQMAAAVPSSALATLYAGQEYFAFSLGINHLKTVGTGSCAGCDVPVVVFLSSIRLTTSTPANDFRMTRGANWVGSQYVSWQQGYPVNITRGCGMTGGGLFCAFPYVHFDVVPYDVTSTRNSTWGQVKALYR